MATAALFLSALPIAWGSKIFVDQNLSRSCSGTYSVSVRDASGKDGDAYKTVVEAANVAQAGDTVFIRSGTYHSTDSVEQNDILWPKHSGTTDSPIVFKAYEKEKVVLGDGPAGYPGEGSMSIARALVTLKDVGHISFEGLSFAKAEGWVFARNCNHLVFRNCTFEDARRGAKGTARFVECRDGRFLNCSFIRSSFDGLTLEKCERMLVENCTFVSAAHALLAIRGSSDNVIRHCTFKNPYFERKRSEKLVEVFDLKLDHRNPTNPSYVATPTYNSTRRNLFENNYFGYFPFRPNRGAQPSAIQYSGQYGIIRRNVFANPPLRAPDPEAPDAVAGGLGLAMRWGGSWDGWKQRADGTGRWWGEGHEAGYVTHNRIYQNVFFGYDQGCISLPRADAVSRMLNPPPMNEANPPEQFTTRFAFEDNRFVNNIIAPGTYQPHMNWAWQKMLAGKPIAVVALGLLDKVSFRNNAFYSGDDSREAHVYVGDLSGGKGRGTVLAASRCDIEFRQTFTNNLERSPEFMDATANDFRLAKQSGLIDAGAFVTTTAGAGTETTEMHLHDTGYFYDGFGIEGEAGDLIQLEGEKETALITQIDAKSGKVTLNRPLSWRDGQGVALAYSGKAPDIGAFEEGKPIKVGVTGTSSGK